jgi:hypothetical protein
VSFYCPVDRAFFHKPATNKKKRREYKTNILTSVVSSISEVFCLK